MKLLQSFLQPKKFISILMAIVFSIMAINGVVSAEQFLTVFTIVISFYFAQKED